MVRSVKLVAISAVLLFVLLDTAFAVGPGAKLTWPGGGRGKVTFNGDDHGDENYTCADCHSGLFAMKFGAARMTMAAMDRGEYCGACHNGVRAFSTGDQLRCDVCHVKPKKHRMRDGEDF